MFKNATLKTRQHIKILCVRVHPNHKIVQLQFTTAATVLCKTVKNYCCIWHRWMGFM